MGQLVADLKIFGFHTASVLDLIRIPLLWGTPENLRKHRETVLK
jgi:hypothetical protein